MSESFPDSKPPEIQLTSGENLRMSTKTKNIYLPVRVNVCFDNNNNNSDNKNKKDNDNKNSDNNNSDNNNNNNSGCEQDLDKIVGIVINRVYEVIPEFLELLKTHKEV